MRILGYPPGWLEEAKFVYSNLELFDSEGKNVKLQGSKKNRGLNSEKIVDYPGFNMSMDRNMKDEYKQYQVPPYSENYSKKIMLDFFAKQFCTEDEENETINTKASNENKDEKEPECKPKHHLLIAVQEKEFGVPSPSLTDLEKEKENLLAALDDNSSSNLKSEENTSEVPDQTADPKASGNAEEADVQEKDSSGSSEKVSVNDTLKIDVEAAEDSSSSNVSPPLNTSVNCVKTSAFGTPILKSNSPFSRLPKADNFMKDVSPVINFENLPDSTGKYEQMTNVLQKVRNTMKHLQNCKS
ncbi:hypothetical protein JTB14_001850 [Gonioctena quinquepunctata]|nr:hypothetical protein JTB14_001850 [Gonioctena quinquepunctata]